MSQPSHVRGKLQKLFVFQSMGHGDVGNPCKDRQMAPANIGSQQMLREC